MKKFLIGFTVTIFLANCCKAQYVHFDPIPYVPEPTPVYIAPQMPIMPALPPAHYNAPTPTDAVYSVWAIKYAAINEKDFSTQYQNDTAKIVIYRKNGVLSMCLIMLARHSQSFGAITNVTNNDEPATNTSYHTSTASFDWSFQNTYDSVTGNAIVSIKQVDNPSGIRFIAEIKTDKAIMRFQGYKQR